ncbi:MULTISPECIES: ABC transporter permease [Paenibacillus]|uniref:ABC transporter permease n=1 Tax=Paenibacillus TaxID=44249 RepID=UPI0011A26526|nr:ABC transporter permease [Paenibacillus sp. IHBB 10380]
MKQKLNEITFWSYRNLILQLSRREVTQRYKGSYLGILWSFINPLIMLTVFTFVFSVMFQARWNMGNENKTEFALVLFCGLLTFNIFSEMLTKSTRLVIGNVNFVKKVVFPLEVLPIVLLNSALVNAFISLLILIVGVICFLGTFNWTIVFVPIVLTPLILLSIGLSWILSSLSVFLKDIDQIVVSAVQVLMFLSPVFYPISNVPTELRSIFYLNPLSYVVEDMRRVVIWGLLPDWNWLLTGTALGLLCTFAGLLCFKKLKGGFADVL